MVRFKERPVWNSSHHRTFSAVNDRMSANTRSYFDRGREAESYGTRYEAAIYPTWVLDFGTPKKDPRFESKAYGASPPKMSDHFKLELRRTLSCPDGFRRDRAQRSRERPALFPEPQGLLGWDSRHHILADKDNHLIHSNVRSYFDRPRHFRG
eukprot:gnl/MRDRNA2_/MRDRNA2_93304_c0_seq1.p1 gnl/MRDRNA2_/MRDRNA2_93304_c0~~gnl/MRDRNA2_/MRDRNA2_93304_c0_seq1.p1  ORF type:complete len:153 (-),score=8.23 gnl/MRDRNA2_/MRDRNA2_93304_c0_seq1:53-511(-)